MYSFGVPSFGLEFPVSVRSSFAFCFRHWFMSRGPITLLQQAAVIFYGWRLCDALFLKWCGAYVHHLEILRYLPTWSIFIIEAYSQRVHCQQPSCKSKWRMAQSGKRALFWCFFILWAMLNNLNRLIFYSQLNPALCMRVTYLGRRPMSSY